MATYWWLCLGNSIRSSPLPNLNMEYGCRSAHPFHSPLHIPRINMCFLLNPVYDTIISPQNGSYHQPTNQPTQPTNQPNQPTNQLTNQPTQPTNQPTHPTNQPTNPTNQPTNPTNQPTQPTNQPTNQLTNQPTKVCLNPGKILCSQTIDFDVSIGL